MNKPLTACLALLLGSTAALANDAALRQCRALTNAAARLACYDAVPLPPLPPPAPAAAPVAVPAAAPAAVPAAAPVAAPVADPATTLEAQFGLPAPSERVPQLVTRFEGEFDGWRPNDRIRLANGQVWQVVDGSSAVYALKNPKVTIKRGALGRFVLDIDGAAKMPGVRRVE